MQIQLQRDGESNRCWFGRLIIRIVANLGEQLPINICFLIDLGILFAAAVDELKRVSEKPSSRCISRSSSLPETVGAIIGTDTVSSRLAFARLSAAPIRRSARA